jgi:hypothetical protein
LEWRFALNEHMSGGAVRTPVMILPKSWTGG